MTKADAVKRLSAAAVGFTENVGQWDSRGKFLSRTRNVDVWVTSNGAVYDYYALTGRSAKRKGHVVKMSFEGGKAATVSGRSSLPGGSEYWQGNSQPKTARRYSDVLQKGIYPGVDARFYVDSGKPRYDLLVAPNTDPKQIHLRFSGANRVDLKGGEVALNTQLGVLKNGRPFAFQLKDGKRQVVSASYAMRKDGSVGIALGSYDRSRALVIDPLVYGSYYGGESGHDEVRQVVSDLDGGVYLVGSTEASDFPALQGPYSFNQIGGQDGFVAKLQGDAYANIYAAYFGGSQRDLPMYCSLDPFGNLWVAGRTYSTDFPSNPRDNIQFLTGDGSATGGTFVMWYRTTSNRTAPLPWNATPQQVFNALNGLNGLQNQVISVQAVGNSNLPGGQYKIVTNGDLAPHPIGAISEGGTAFGLKPFFVLSNTATETRITNNRSIPVAGSWVLRFTNGTTVADTTAIPFNANATVLQGILNSLTNLSNGSFTVTGGPLSGPNPTRYDIRFTPQNGVPGPANLLIVSQNFLPQPVYSTTKDSDIFVMRWAKDSIKVLNPLPDKVLIFGGDHAENLAGFAVRQNDTPNVGDPVLIGFGGDSNGPLNEIVGNQTNNSWLARYTFDGSSFAINSAATKYLEGWATTNLGGFAMDHEGNSYVTGSLTTGGNDDDPNASGSFPVTSGIFLNGDKIRGIDVYVRKYNQAGQLLISGILGGNGDDTVGGFDFDPTGLSMNSGSAVAVDNQNNIYVTGVARSFNFPRTRGVYGETFTANSNIFVTKVASDGRTLSYSTNLRTSGLVLPAGIAVDASGNAYVAGNGHPNWVNFPETLGQMPGDPEQPVGTSFPTISLVNPLDGTYDSPATPNFPTQEGFLSVLNPTGTSLLYGSWAGGFLDDMIFAPYVDRFGDVWINGWTDSFRQFVRTSSQGTPTVYQDNGSLPASLISPLAFKSTPAASGATSSTLVYGGYGDQGGQTWTPATINAVYQRDGWLAKLRVSGAANIQSITLNPGTVPGGLGAQSIGTVTLTAPAPGGGASVEISIDNGNAASLDPSNPVTSTVITIPEGSTSAQFTVYTKPVSTNTPVQVRATYLGSFQIAQLNVVPWLQSVSVTPNTLVGGNVTSGRITLAAKAPAGGVSVDITTDRPSLISFPGGATVVVPEGQDSAIFSIKTAGVAKKSFAVVTGSVAGVNRSSAITLTTANLLTLTFSPAVLAGLGTTTGTIKLDGEAGSNFTVTLTGLPSTYKYPSSVSFKAGDTQKTFTVVTPFEPTQVDRSVTATRAASGGSDGYQANQLTGSFTVTFVALKDISVTPNPVEGGANADGLVQLSQPAPAGGVIVKLSSPLASVKFDKNEIVIPEGSLSGSFTVFTPVLQNDTVATIKAFRGTNVVSTKLTIKSASFGMTLSPESVVGGNQNVTGTITLARAAGTGGLTVALSSDDPSVTVPASVTIPEGSKTVTFTATTTSVTTNRDVTITGTLGSTVVTATFEVRAIGLVSVVFDSASVRGGTVAPVTISLDAPAPAGGLTVSLSESNNLFSNLPPTVQIPAGQTSIRLSSLLTKRVSRDQTTVLTATTAGSQASGALKVIRAF